jgi:hypothetical protein
LPKSQTANPFVYRKDENHDEIVEFFRSRGAIVDDTARIGNGFPDLLVTYQLVTFWVEIKSQSGRLNKKQRKWFIEHEDALAFVIRAESEAQDILDAINKGWLVSKGGYECIC